MGLSILIFAENKRSIKTKHMEKGIIVKDVDGCSTWTVPRAVFTHKPIYIITGERSVPLSLGLAAYCTLVDNFGELTAGVS
jgi:hypothetical protein